MSQPYVGEIRMFAGNFAPAGWAFCDGQLLPISEHETLFNLIGTTYGGDGQSTFAMPDMRGRIPIHAGQGQGLSNKILAETGGSEEVTLSPAQLPAHNHPLQVSTDTGPEANPQGNFLAASNLLEAYADEFATNNMAPGLINAVGGSQPHNNIMPFQCLNYIISLFGIFPSPT